MPGVHYDPIPEPLIIPAGLDSVDVLINPIDNPIGDGAQTVTVTLGLETTASASTTSSPTPAPTSSSSNAPTKSSGPVGN